MTWSRIRVNREKNSRAAGTRAVGISSNKESSKWDDTENVL